MFLYIIISIIMIVICILDACRIMVMAPLI